MRMAATSNFFPPPRPQALAVVCVAQPEWSGNTSDFRFTSKQKHGEW